MWEVQNFESTFPTSHACNADCFHDSPFQLYQAHEFLVPASPQANANHGLKWAHLRGPVKWVQLELLVEMDDFIIHTCIASYPGLGTRLIHVACIIEIFCPCTCIKGRSCTKLTFHKTLPTIWSFCHVFYSANTDKVGAPIMRQHVLWMLTTEKPSFRVCYHKMLEFDLSVWGL